jgi:hypothetical protein
MGNLKAEIVKMVALELYKDASYMEKKAFWGAAFKGAKAFAKTGPAKKTMGQKAFGRSLPAVKAAGRAATKVPGAAVKAAGAAGKAAIWTGKQFFHKNPVRTAAAWGTTGAIGGALSSKQNTRTF